MPQVSLLELRTSSIPDNQARVDVTVSFGLSFLPSELDNIFDIRIEIWGADKGLKGQDEKLIHFHRELLVSREGSIRFSISKKLLVRVLNEDRDGRDELYARLMVEPVASAARADSVIVQIDV